ncbi:MAG: LapA family protein [Pseudomonadales bacterium]|jgi:uncharacterized membrane protein YciS (DUF1049 family)|nr:LapA family protein [Pseudomonadales bacterium]MDP6472061.1 LapA family protein [Pseudomonadales bacterium]MDP6826666.1 LapA family protein [Pseudomonadales bacterium]MDP6969973.1 LapA family protein [Pseudomonadales bacterium]|tara:strand:- start:139 stop:432 length:294 start_codon:yes stop_codon:yes gene_type:complete
MSWLGRVLIFVSAVVVFVFAAIAVNQTHISLTFLLWTTPEISVFWWLLIAFITGLSLGALWFAVVSTRQRLREAKLNRELSASQKELSQLRNLPVQE